MTDAPDRGRIAAPQEARTLAAAEAKIATLETALESARMIGTAIGILVERLKIAPGDAFDSLVEASHEEHRKVRDIASDLVFTGELGHVAPYPVS